MTDKDYRLEKARELNRMLDNFKPGPNFYDDRSTKQQVMDIFRTFAATHDIGVMNIPHISYQGYVFTMGPHSFERDLESRVYTCKCCAYRVEIDYEKWKPSVDSLMDIFKGVEDEFHLSPWNQELLVEKAKNKPIVKVDVKSLYPKQIITTALGTNTLPLSGNKYHYVVPKGWRVPEIKDVKFEDPATIVFWGDGTKTVVKAQGEEYDPEKGLAMAISRKALGNEYGYYNTFKHWLKKWKKKSKKTYKHDESVPINLAKAGVSLDYIVRNTVETTKTCAYYGMPATTLPCSECVDHKNYILNSVGSDNEPKRSCDNCLYDNAADKHLHPICSACHYRSRWEPKEDDK